MRISDCARSRLSMLLDSHSLLSVVGNVLVMASVTLMGGCSSQPSAIKPADVDPASAATKAIEVYDKDGDGALAGAELDAVPGIHKHQDKYDSNQDGTLTESEIRDRIAGWEKQGLGMRGLSVTVTLDGNPLENATVLFEPEPYLGEVIHPATGITGPRGSTRVGMAEEFLPKQLQGKHGAFISGGTFKIRVTHPTKTIPAKFNKATILGEEVAPDTVRSGVAVALKSK